MEASKVIEGLQIIQKSKPETESDYHIRAEHDAIYAGSLEWKISDEDKNKLDELGWCSDDEADGWRAFV